MIGKNSRRPLTDLYYEDTMRQWNQENPVDIGLQKKWLACMVEIGKRAEEQLKNLEKEEKKKK